MAIWGADVEELKALGTDLTNKASDIKGILAQLNSKLQGTTWSGPDADRFRNNWNSQHVPALNKVIAELNTAGGDAKKNAEQQRSTSL